MRKKLKKHKYITKTGLLILSLIAVVLYFRFINIFYTDIYLDMIFKLINSVDNDVIPIHIFSMVYKNFRKDILGY